MVRVISIHNFLKQDISSVDELIDLAVVPPDILLLAQSDHTIFVKDLSLVNDCGFNILTVDQVIKIVYSIHGNYIGTLEKKITRNGVDVFYIRIYLNWETLRNYREPPPMRARIAGRVTPLSQNFEGLEMIEIPAHNMPDNIACCPISGNLILSSKNTLTIYKLKIQMHDISKMYFIDFEQISVDFLLSFIPTRMQLVENIVAVQNDEFLHVFKITTKFYFNESESIDKEFSNEDIECGKENPLPRDKQRVINYEKLRNDNRLRCVRPAKNSVLESRGELTKISPYSFPIKHDFPTVVASKSTEPICSNIHKQSPFLAGHDLVVNMISLTEPEDGKVPFKIENILQYQLMPLVLGSWTNHEIQEKFTCLILKPLYSSNSNSGGVKSKLLGSERSGQLKTVMCFFGTQQEGYLHCFEYDVADKQGVMENYVIYPFTAPVVQVKLEDTFLHAVTDTGLETYTMRAAKHLMKNSDNTACPSNDDPICLIGLRPFVNVFKMSLTNHYLILFANNQESSNCVWTLYKLNLPSVCSIWQDFLTAANENKWEAPATYSQLVGEGHLILKTSLNSTKWISKIDGSESHMYIPTPFIDRVERSIVENLYNESCALLGDFHMLNEDFLKASNYYQMSSYRILEIVRRIEGLVDKIPDKFKGSYNEQSNRKGLIFHLKKILALNDEKYSTFTGNREEFYTLEIGNVVNVLLDYLEKECNLSISDLILNSVVLREFSTDRILKMMKNVISRRSPPEEKDALSLALMCIQRDQVEQAKTVLKTIKAEHLDNLILRYDHLLFEKSCSTKFRSFSELSMVLIETYPLIMGRTLSYLVTEKHSLNLSTLLNTFLEIPPSRTVQSRNSSVVLQTVLQNYFKFYFERSKLWKYDFKSTEALKILIRIYLTFLRHKTKSNGDLIADDPEEQVLFYSSRRSYLKQIPPFGPDFTEILSPKHGASCETTSEKELKSTLLRIQSLLSYENIPPECAAEVRNYICSQTSVYGSLSLQVLSAANVQEALQLLINFAPQAVLQFTKDCVRGIEDWKFLVKQVQSKVNAGEDESPRKFYYRKILTDLLLHGAKTLEIEDLVEILPRDLDNSESYFTLAQNNAQANHIKTLIMTTGKQLETTLFENVSSKNGQLNA